jgi:N12 class adenine-specific DNA methylase/adenine-specific DNA methylase
MADDIIERLKKEYGIGQSGNNSADDALRADAIKRGAQSLGIDPEDYATAMSYESSGSFDPWKKGPVTKWGQHRGTIQYGEPQQRQYGVHQGQTFEDQVTNSNVRYLKDHGVMPGMKFPQIYAAINGGHVSADLNTQDANTGRTISDNIRNADRDHRPEVRKRFGQYFGSNAGAATFDYEGAMSSLLAPTKAAQTAAGTPPARRRGTTFPNQGASSIPQAPVAPVQPAAPTAEQPVTVPPAEPPTTAPPPTAGPTPEQTARAQKLGVDVQSIQDADVENARPAYDPPTEVDIVAAQKWIDSIMGKTQQPPNGVAFTADVDPEFDTGATDKGENVFRQAAEQWSRSEFGRPLSKPEEELLVEYQKQKHKGFVFENETDKPLEPYKGKYDLHTDDVKDWTQLLAQNQDKFAKDRTDNLREFLAAGGQLTDDARKQFRDLGFTDEEMDKLSGLDPETGTYAANDFTQAVAARRKEFTDMVDLYRQAPDEDTKMNAVTYARRAMGWLSPDKAEEEVADYYKLKDEKRQELGGRVISSAFRTIGDDQTADNVQKAADSNLQDYLVRTIGKYGTAANHYAVQKQEQLAETARKDRVAQMSWPEYLGGAVGGWTIGIPKTAVSVAIASSLRGIGLSAKAIDDAIYGKDANPRKKVSDYATYRLGNSVDGFLDNALPLNKDLQNDFFAGKLPQGIGSTIGMAVGGASKFPRVAIAVMSSLQMGGDAYKEAIDNGATEEQAQMYGMLSAPLGVTEIVGVGDAIVRLNKGVGGSVWRKMYREAITEGLKESGEEIAQEGTQDIAQNIIANLTYDPDRKWDKDVYDNMLVAGISAPLASVGTTILNTARNRYAINQAIKQEQANGVIIKSYGEGELYVFDQKVPVTRELEPLVERYNFTRNGVQQIQAEIEATQAAGKHATTPEQTAPFLKRIWDLKAELNDLTRRQVVISRDIAERSGVGLPEGTVGDSLIPPTDQAAGLKPDPEQIAQASKDDEFLKPYRDRIQALVDRGEIAPSLEQSLHQQLADGMVSDVEGHLNQIEAQAGPATQNEQTSPAIPEQAASVDEAQNVPTPEIQPPSAPVTGTPDQGTPSVQSQAEAPKIKKTGTTGRTDGTGRPIHEFTIEHPDGTTEVMTGTSREDVRNKQRPPIKLQGLPLEDKGTGATDAATAQTGPSTTYDDGKPLAPIHKKRITAIDKELKTADPATAKDLQEERAGILSGKYAPVDEIRSPELSVNNKPEPTPMQKFMADDRAHDIINSDDFADHIDELYEIGKNHGLSTKDVEGVVNRATENKQRRDSERQTENIVREPRTPTGSTTQGAETTVLTPESGKSYQARYVIREAADVHPSHNPITFQPNPDYYYTNDRHYDREEQYQKQVIDRSKVFKPEYFVTDTPTAGDGPPVIDQEGNVLGGNSRTMILHRIYEDENSSARTAYQLALEKKAERFGIDPKELSKYERPVLVREISDESINKQHAITELNETSTTPLTANEQAVAEAGKMSDEAVDYITNKLVVTGADATLSEVLNSHGPEIVNYLIKEKVFSEGDRNKLLDDGKITEDGKKRIERLLLGRVFTDLGQIENAPASVKNTVIRIIAPLMRVNEDAEWNILPDVQEGIELLNEAKAAGQGKYIEAFAANRNFLRPQGWSTQAIGIAKTLNLGQLKAANQFKQYAEDMRLAKYGSGAMFDMGAKTQAEAYKEAFGVQPAPVEQTKPEKPAEKKGTEEKSKYANFKDSLGIPRDEMPQITRDDQAEFQEFAKSQGVEIKPETVAASKLKPTQTQYNPTQAAQLPEEALSKPLMVSSDNRVLDGHNTLVKLQEGDPNREVNILRVPLRAKEALALMRAFPKSLSKSIADVGATPLPTVLEHNGITLNIKPLPGPGDPHGLTAQNSEIQDKTIREVVRDPQAWLDKYDAHDGTKGGTEINSDLAKELFPEYLADPLAHVSAVHVASGLISDLAFQTKVKTLPKGSRVLFLAGGGGSGKGYALKNVIKTNHALVVDGTMKTGENNITNMRTVIDAGHHPQLVAVFTPANVAAVQNVRRSISHDRLVPKGPLVSGHNGFRQEFIGPTKDFADRMDVDVKFLFNDGKSEPKEISFEEFENLVHNEDGKVENTIVDATYDELERGQFKDKPYDPRLRDAFDGKPIPAKDAGAESGRPGSADSDGRGNQAGDSSGEQGPGPERPVSPPVDFGALFDQAASDKFDKTPEETTKKDALSGLADAFGFDDIPGLKSVVAPEEPALDEDRYKTVQPALDAAFNAFKTDNPAASMRQLLDALEENGFTENHIRQMKPYIVRFMSDKYALQSQPNESIDETDGQIDSNNSDQRGGVQADNGLGVGTQDAASNENTPGDLASGQSAEDGGTQQGGKPVSSDQETGSESGPGSGPESGSEQSTSSDIRDLADGRTAIAPATGNFHVSDELDFGSSFSQKTRAKANIAALRLLNTLDEENRTATPEEQKILAQYVGWGGIPQIFDERKADWRKEYEELRELLPIDEYEKARRSTQDAHFTSKTVVNAIWNGLQHLGFRHGAVLEPSMGVGNFFGLMPRVSEAFSQLTGVELEPLTAKIAKHLYPNTEIYNRGFQDFYVAPNSQDVVIGNPPFGAGSVRDTRSKELSKLKIHGYFFARGIDALRPGGLLGMVVSDGFLDATDSQAKAAREYVSARARLVGAIRLPNTAFKGNANTEVTTDIIFLQRTDLTRSPNADQAKRLAELENLLRHRDHADDPEALEQEQAELLALTRTVTPNPEEWLEVGEITDEATGKPIKINKYFVDHPEKMLGKMTLAGSMYGGRGDEPALLPRDGQDLEKDLSAAIAELPKDVITDTQAATTDRFLGAEQKTMEDYPNMKPFNMGIDANGKPFMLKVNPNGIASEAPMNLEGKALERAKGLIGIREIATQYISKQAQEETTEEDLRPLREELNKRYDAFVAKHGFINQEANKRIFREDADYPLLQALEKNFDKGVSAAIAKKEGVEPRQPSAAKSDIMLRRTNFPLKEITSANSAHDALILSLVNRGRLDMDYVSELYGKPVDQIVNELGDAIFYDPAQEAHVLSEEYLSGDVKTKLAEAQQAASDKPELNRNVVALQKVQPKDVPAADIFVKLGSSWVPFEIYNDFFKHLTGGTLEGAWSPELGRYTGLRARAVSGTANTERWGTRRAPASRIIQAIMSSRDPVVRDPVFGTNPTQYVINQEDTAAAVGKADEMRDEFKRWIWDDADRRKRLVGLYNERMNRIVKRVHDGSYLVDENGKTKIPGLSGLLNLRPHILNAVSRILQTGKALIDHAVGAGKTPLSITAAMEMRRLGQSKKPMFVVPNHLIEQWAQEFKKFYPGANVLAASRTDFKKEKRQQLFAKIATGDWDAVVVAHSSFSFIGVPVEVETKFIREQLDEIMTAIRAEEQAALDAGLRRKPRSVKDLERLRDKLLARLQTLADTPRDNLLDFAEMGVDSLFVDEAHKYKNLYFTTQLQGVSGLGNTKGSQRAFDMFMKTQMILQRNNNRNVVFLTGTPVSNSLSEIFHMQRFLQNDVLKERGIATFDSWANTFAEHVQDWEINAAGQFKPKTRFTRLANLPELKQLWQSVTDSISHKDLQEQAEARGDKFPIPKVNHIQVIADRSPEQAAYIGIPREQVDAEGFPIIDLQTGEQKVEYDTGTIIHRLEHWKDLEYIGPDGMPHEENVLRITTHARQAGLDMRLRNDQAPDFEKSKLNRAAENIVKAYKENDHRKGTQLVFLDVTSPKGKTNRADVRPDAEAAEAGEAPEVSEESLNPDDVYTSDQNFDAYQDLRRKLIDQGIPANQIAFIHDYNTDLQKADLFAKMNRGDLRVLFGSTPKMGEGMNVQKKLVALHNLDAPWKPSDLEQRNGRIIRQGNEFYEADPDNFTVDIFDYATEKTYDSRMWEINEQKGSAIDRFRFAGDDVREIEDISAESANAAEMKAAASGDPRILESIKLQGEVRKLETQARSDQQSKFDMQERIGKFDRQDTPDHRRVEDLERAEKVAKANPLIPDETMIRFGDKEYLAKDLGSDDGAEEAKAYLVGRFERAALTTSAEGRLWYQDVSGTGDGQGVYIGTYRGFAIHARNTGYKNMAVNLSIIGEDKPIDYSIIDGLRERLEANDQGGVSVRGILVRLNNMINGMEERAASAREILAHKEKEITAARATAYEPFIKQQELVDKRARSAALLQELRAGGNIEFKADEENTVMADDFGAPYDRANKIEFQRTEYTNPAGEHTYLFRVFTDANVKGHLTQGPPERLGLDSDTLKYVKEHQSGVMINRMAGIANDEFTDDEYDSEDDPLYSKITDESVPDDERMTVEDMRDQPYKPLEDIVRSAQIERVRPGVLKMNPTSHELLRRTNEQLRIEAAAAQGKKLKESDYEDLFGGEFLEPRHLQNVVSMLKQKADEARRLGYDDQFVKTLTDHADALEQASKDAGKRCRLYPVSRSAA